MAHQPPLIDMDDPPEEIALRWPQLTDDLKVINSLINPVFEKADKRAIAHQRLHRRLVLIAAMSGTAAVLLAILQLSALFQHNSESVVVLEAVAVVSALIAVSTGIVVAFSTNWLVEREKAERCRALKFQYLLATGGNSDVENTARLRKQLSVVEQLKHQGFKDWLFEPITAQQIAVSSPSDDQRLALVLEYYRVKRLGYQRDRYFAVQARRSHFWERLTKRIPPLCFFLSIAAALSHFIIDMRHPEHGSSPHGTGLILIMLAAMLPVMGAAIRTVRTANEFGRNSLRYEATFTALSRFETEWANANDTRRKAIGEHIEEFLEAERREWLRLMIEAEWFG